MSTSLVGIKPPDEKWKQMKAIWDACRSAKIDPPKEVEDFFDGEIPDDKGVVVGLSKYTRRREAGHHPAIRDWSSDSGMGFEVDLSKLDKDITILRFKNTW